MFCKIIRKVLQNEQTGNFVNSTEKFTKMPQNLGEPDTANSQTVHIFRLYYTWEEMELLAGLHPKGSRMTHIGKEHGYECVDKEQNRSGLD